MYSVMGSLGLSSFAIVKQLFYNRIWCSRKRKVFTIVPTNGNLQYSVLHEKCVGVSRSTISRFWLVSKMHPEIMLDHQSVYTVTSTVSVFLTSTHFLYHTSYCWNEPYWFSSPAVSYSNNKRQWVHQVMDLQYHTYVKVRKIVHTSSIISDNANSSRTLQLKLLMPRIGILFQSIAITAIYGLH